MDLQKAGPGWGYLYLPDIQAEVARWGNELKLEGSTNSVFFGNIYVCDACRRPNGSKDREGKFVDCKGCSQPINKQTQVHKIFYENRRLAHIDSVFFAGESLGTLVAAPWQCRYCDKMNQAHDHRCGSCGADPFAGVGKNYTPEVIPHGVDLILTPDSSEIDGYRLVPRENRTKVIARNTGKVLASAAGPIVSRITPYAQAAAQKVAPVTERVRHMSRRQFIASAATASAALTGFIWWQLQPHVTDLPESQTLSGIVVERRMSRKIEILHKRRDFTEVLPPLTKTYQTDQPEAFNAPGIIEWPHVDPKVANNTREYRLHPTESHEIVVVAGNYVAPLSMAPGQIEQFRVGDRVKLTIAEGGAEIGVQRELP